MNKILVVFFLLGGYIGLFAQDSFQRELSGLGGLPFFYPYLGNGTNRDLSIMLKYGKGFALLFYPIC